MKRSDAELSNQPRPWRSPMVQWVVLKQISCGWFQQLGFGKYCSADDRSFSLEVLDICCLCRPVCGWSCTSWTVKQIFLSAEDWDNSDWLASPLSLLLKNVHHQIQLRLTCCMRGGKLNISSRLLASFVVTVITLRVTNSRQMFQADTERLQFAHFLFLSQNYHDIIINFPHRLSLSSIFQSILQALLKFYILCKNSIQFTPVTQAWISHAVELIECWRTSWKWLRHF